MALLPPVTRLATAHDEVTSGDPTRGHWMAVHTDPRRLIDIIVDFLRPAMAAGGTAVAVARREAHAAIREGLDDLQPHGSFLLLDSRTTLDALVPDHLDGGRFESTVGARIRGAAASGPVRAYGDMVDVLASEGRVDDAASLEALWNGLRRDVDFDLLCGYHARRFMVHGGQSRLFRLADLHDRLELPSQA